MKPIRMGFSYWAGRGLFRIFFAVYFRWRVIDAGLVPIEGSVILAANHASMLDPPLVGSGLRRMVIMLARRTLFRFPLAGRILRSWHAVPVDQESGSAAALKTILARLRDGHAVLIFPEGTRSRDGGLQPGRAGLGLIVVKSEAPVVPVRLFGTHEAFGRGRKFPRPRRITVKYGHPLTFSELREEATGATKERYKEICQEISDRIMSEISAMGSDLSN